ncbi:uncharacterized protein BCR38DRAFT_460921 [Pseudomassariella vexata]|uniref:Uncharacterized protein n=1 Tax=Pseudomassariella vexata TaxID=1141098 RepID=A0A1Y2DG37_9PEZI|nr:uncharacterized protein BCR38DRAFT_460921 [Pseudomassariella vexata]ORY58076.1 hypothetical protein BCR38DRAFT_460921 [Pseudomassariella vexata]
MQLVHIQAPRHFDAEIAINKYRGPALDAPTTEIDDTWHEIGLGASGIRLAEGYLRILNKPDMTGRPLHRIPEEFGGGYLGLLEIFHLLHCLDSLRQATFYNWDSTLTLRPDHCIDAVRFSLMCTSDVTPITFFDSESLPGRQLPLPNFSSLHTCRNLDQILEWNMNNPNQVLWEETGNASTFKPNVKTGPGHQNKVA